MNTEIQDISEKFPDALKAEQQGKNILVLWKLEQPRKPLNGKLCTLQLFHYWLRNSEDITSVQGSDYTLWQKKELNLEQSLFDQVNLF